MSSDSDSPLRMTWRNHPWFTDKENQRPNPEFEKTFQRYFLENCKESAITYWEVFENLRKLEYSAFF